MNKPYKQIIQVVPQLKPGRCGVSDHALLLAEALHTSFGVSSCFAVLNSDERNEVPFPVIFGAQEDLREICERIAGAESTAVLIHLSGYGYARNGAPDRLERAIEELKHAGIFPIAVYFHELFVNTMPWRSSFWHRQKQIRAVGRIARHAQLLATSIEEYESWLREVPQRRPDSSLLKLPLFSTVGETDNPVAAMQRDPAMIVFGLEGTRRRAYRELISKKRLLSALGISHILDIGPGEAAPNDVAGISIRKLGRLSAPDLAETLMKTRFAYISNPAQHLGKSSVFAGCCAHGTISVIAKAFTRTTDGLNDGVEVVSKQTVLADADRDWDACSKAAWKWYRGHRLNFHAEAYARWMGHKALADSNQALAFEGNVAGTTEREKAS